MAPKRKRSDDTAAVAEPSSSTRVTRSSTRSETGTKTGSEATTSMLSQTKRSTAKAASKLATVAGAGITSAKTSVDTSETTIEVQSPVKKAKTKTLKSDSVKPVAVRGKPQSSGSRSTKIVPPALSSQEHNSNVMTVAGRLKRDEPHSSSYVPDTKIASTTPAATTAATAPTTTAALTSTSTRSVTSKPQPQSSTVKIEPYTAARAIDLFQKYADDDNHDIIGPEGFEQLCTDAQIPLEGVLPLILAWQLNAKEMGKFTKDEWTKGTGSLKISSLSQLAIALVDLENLLVLGKPPLKRPLSAGMGTTSGIKKKRSGDNEPYDRTAYWGYVADKKATFQKLYAFCFVLAKPDVLNRSPYPMDNRRQARNIDMETATAFWSVLLVPKYPLMGEVIEYINEKGSYKGANKDLWSMMLEFCDTVNPRLEDYEAEGAWPTLLDDFVAWKKDKVGNANEGNGNAAITSDDS